MSDDNKLVSPLHPVIMKFLEDSFPGLPIYKLVLTIDYESLRPVELVIECAVGESRCKKIFELLSKCEVKEITSDQNPATA